jgi:GTP-binding protein
MEKTSLQTIRESQPLRLPTVAIVGRPNVGKSTLFNRLVGRRVAIVEDTPGITRDRLYGEAEWRGQAFQVVDTGGVLLEDEDPLVTQVRLQALAAIEEAEVILFLVDAIEGITPADEELADVLRTTHKPVLLLVNKVDNLRRQADAAEFYALGWEEMFPISAIHGHGVADVLDRVVELLPPAKLAEEDETAVNLAIVGRPNVGKSSLVNAILGAPRVIVSEIPGTTRDAIDTPFERDGQRMVLIDTAGIRRPGKVQGSVEYYSVLRAQRAVQRCDVALLVLDGPQGVTDGDKRVGGYAVEAGRACVVVVNKWDLMKNPSSKTLMMDFTRIFRKECPFLHFAPLVFASALTGMGISAVVDTALEAAEAHAHRIPTGVLNRLIHDAVDARPYTRKGKMLKVYYATMPSVKPPTVVLFVNDPDIMHFSYLRYLENAIRQQFPLEGTPIRIEVREATGKQRDS